MIKYLFKQLKFDIWLIAFILFVLLAIFFYFFKQLVQFGKLS